MSSAWPTHKDTASVFVDTNGNRVGATIVDEIVEPQGDGQLVYLQMWRLPMATSKRM